MVTDRQDFAEIRTRIEAKCHSAAAVALVSGGVTLQVQEGATLAAPAADSATAAGTGATHSSTLAAPSTGDVATDAIATTNSVPPNATEAASAITPAPVLIAAGRRGVHARLGRGDSFPAPAIATTAVPVPLFDEPATASVTLTDAAIGEVAGMSGVVAHAAAAPATVTGSGTIAAAATSDMRSADIPKVAAKRAVDDVSNLSKRGKRVHKR